MAGEFAAHIRTGDVCSVEEVRGWLDHTGWRFADHRPLAGPQSLIIAQAAVAAGWITPRLTVPWGR